MSERSRVIALVAALGLAASSCGSVEDDAGGGSGGTGGSAGATGGSSAGGSSGGSECTKASDCTLFDDCCSCESLASGESGLRCPADCVQGVCDRFGVDRVACRNGRCVLDLSCDHSKVACRAAEPECLDGMIASVIDVCWGPCIFERDCGER